MFLLVSFFLYTSPKKRRPSPWSIKKQSRNRARSHSHSPPSANPTPPVTNFFNNNPSTNWPIPIMGLKHDPLQNPPNQWVLLLSSFFFSFSIPHLTYSFLSHIRWKMKIALFCYFNSFLCFCPKLYEGLSFIFEKKIVYALYFKLSSNHNFWSF